MSKSECHCPRKGEEVIAFSVQLTVGVKTDEFPSPNVQESSGGGCPRGGRGPDRGQIFLHAIGKWGTYWE